MLERWTPDRSVVHLRILRASHQQAHQQLLPPMPAAPPVLHSMPLTANGGALPQELAGLPLQLQAMLGVAEAAAAAAALPPPLPISGQQQAEQHTQHHLEQPQLQGQAPGGTGPSSGTPSTAAGVPLQGMPPQLSLSVALPGAG